MPNQLAIPFKRTYTAVVKQAVRDYILTHTEDHPDAFEWDINTWESLRTNGTGGVIHVERISAAISYHAQLVFILTKFPSDIGLEIAYNEAFSGSSSLPVTLCSLTFERVSVLFNLGALYSQLASLEDRSTPEGLKRASGYYQNAAGVFAYLVSSALPKFTIPPDCEEKPLDLTDSFVKSLELLMLAQAQECVWQRAVIDQYKNGLIARLATQVSSLYAASLHQIRSAASEIRSSFPSEWLSHMEIKQCHFEAAAQYRKSIDELETNRYGHEIRRLLAAEGEAKKGYTVARRGGVAPAVLQDIKSLLDAVQKNRTRAERDNDLIYHQDIPAPSALPPIQGVSMVSSVIPPGISEPQSIIANGGVVFNEMLGWGAREAINIFNDNKRNLIQDQISDAAEQLNDEADRVLQELNLPSALDALEKPVGLPPSLLKKAEEVRLEQGPDRIEASLEDVQRLSQHVMTVLDGAMDILDNEASEDEAARQEMPISRPPSHEANKELVLKQQRYRDVLNQASASDELVRQKWEEWENHILELSWDEDQLEALIPSSTVPTPGQSSTSAKRQTQSHARRLRGLLESLDEIHRSRDDLVARAQRLAEVDDIRSKILKVATNFERWIEVRPAMFEDVSDAELSKYDKFIQGLAEGKQKQTEILDAIKSTHESFLQSRKEDPSVKERENALQYLDLAYHKYREITRNLDEGLKFYNEMIGILTQFKEACKLWSHARSQEARSLARSLSALSIEENSQQSAGSKNDLPRATKARKVVANLPSLTSAEWEVDDLAPAPSLQKSPIKKGRR
ncbi:BRO1-like domain-containing protein [Hygrophoropsis aurantiaca]|uniref:BRO1-like domain-containing protein n=1 Tax=Hygrophoropsis aurantiaca TaxID=72124 RepID=A0ACB8AJ31_9AGAM|nr:BRO1-like domain-containing protein [Hygrophoropsis aurantiaca]